MSKFAVIGALAFCSAVAVARPASDVHACAAVLSTVGEASADSISVSRDDLRSELLAFRRVLERKIESVGFVRLARFAAGRDDKVARLNLRTDTVDELEGNAGAVLRAANATEQSLADLRYLPAHATPVRHVVVGRTGILRHLNAVAGLARNYERQHPLAAGPVLPVRPSKLDVIGRSVATALATLLGSALFYRTGVHVHAAEYWWAGGLGLLAGGVTFGLLPRVFRGTRLTFRNRARFRAGPVEIDPANLRREVDRATDALTSAARYANPKTVSWQSFEIDLALPALAASGAYRRPFPRADQLIESNRAHGDVRPADPRWLRWDRILFFSEDRQQPVLLEFLREPGYAHDLN